MNKAQTYNACMLIEQEIYDLISPDMPYARLYNIARLYWQVLRSYVNEEARMSGEQSKVFVREILDRLGEKKFTVMETVALATYINSCR